MIIRTHFNATLAMLTRVNQSTINLIGVNLKKAGLMTIGGRGRHAPEITPEDMKNIIIGLIAAESAAKSPKAVMTYSDLLCGNKKFGDELTIILSDLNLVRRISRIVVLKNYPEAWIYYAKPVVVGKNGVPHQDEEVQHFVSKENHGDYPGLVISATLDGAALRTALKTATKE